MRKIVRSIMRADAKRKDAKPSRWLKVVFDTYQNKRYGANTRKANQAKGTHRRGLWRSRVAMYAAR